MVIAAATATAMQVRENLVGAMDCLLALSNGTGSGRLTLECGVRAEGRGQSPKLTNRERGLAGVGGGAWERPTGEKEAKMRDGLGARLTENRVCSQVGRMEAVLTCWGVGKDQVVISEG